MDPPKTVFRPATSRHRPDRGSVTCENMAGKRKFGAAEPKVASGAVSEPDGHPERVLQLVQERVLDRMDELEKAVMARDRYLEKTSDEVDDMMADLSPLQMALLKQLAARKYRKV